VVVTGDWRALLEHVPACDLLCVDAPYSKRTHAGHDDGVDGERFNGDEHERMRVDKRNGSVYSVGVNRRRKINYAAWGTEDVHDFVSMWASRARGWFVSITDHVLAPYWAEALEEQGRYVFSPLAFIAPGSRVRLTGDGPAQWACWIVVSRPRTPEFVQWGALPGGYTLPAGQGGKLPVVGGKPLWLLTRLVEDYSRPGDLICDPCCGAGTALVAATLTGRRCIGGDISPEHAELARTWLKNPAAPAPGAEPEPPAGQQTLFGGAP
jgi:hypothetical protein